MSEIDDAIRYLMEDVEDCENAIRSIKDTFKISEIEKEEIDALRTHADESRMLVSWLKELKDYKEHRWIPVSERLPKGSDIVLLSLPPHIDPDGEECSASVVCGHYIGGRNAEWGLSDGDTFGYGLVSVRKGTNPVAWMPLPEPYNPEQTLKYADNPATESALASAT